MHTALITGSTRNIGRAIAERLASDGIGVVVNGRDPAQAEETAQAIRASGGRAIAAAGAITDPESVEEIVGRATTDLGPVDVLVNNAVRRYHAPIEGTDLEEWRRTLSIVLDGAMLCTRAVVPTMRERGWGRIVNIAGVSGQKGASSRAAVVTAKSGLIGFTKAIALETAADGVTVNTVSPGLIDTQRRIPPGEEELAQAHYARELAQVPLGRFGALHEVCATVAFLCSDDAAFITGQTINVNGGLYID
jgi:NAD(P)-dependent dehydrogenase (short-subunit alcohol dehydrogenase family)